MSHPILFFFSNREQFPRKKSRIRERSSWHNIALLFALLLLSFCFAFALLGFVFALLVLRLCFCFHSNVPLSCIFYPCWIWVKSFWLKSKFALLLLGFRFAFALLLLWFAFALLLLLRCLCFACEHFLESCIVSRWRGRLHIKDTFESKAFHSNPVGVQGSSTTDLSQKLFTQIQQGYRVKNMLCIAFLCHALLCFCFAFVLLFM